MLVLLESTGAQYLRSYGAAEDPMPALTELSRSVAEIANVTPNDYQPYVGKSAFAPSTGSVTNSC